MTAFAEELTAALRSGYTVVAVLTHEEERVEALAAEIARGSKRTLKTWSVSRGIAGASGSPAAAVEALREIAADAGPSLWVVKDVHPWLGDPTVVRLLRDVAGTSASRAVILVAPALTVPAELEKDVTVLDLPLPSEQELVASLAELLGKTPAAQAAVNQVGPAMLASAARGLTLREARRAFRRALEGAAGPADLFDRVIAEKRKLLRNTRFLEYAEPKGAARSVGGLGELRRWLTQRAAAFRSEARQWGLPQPKGVFLLGVQGCGKSLAAKAIADLWRLPLLRFDAGAVVDGGGGGASANLRQAVTIAEALSPCVLWIDEIEKVFADEARKGEGAATRVMGAFVTWLQEKTAPVFVVATANRVDTLSPELLRKGRFDEIFFVDLPGLHDRKEILAIHLASRGRDPKGFELDALAKATEKYSGAELEAVVTAALFAAFSENRELSMADLRTAIEETVPLAITMEEEIRALRDWAKTRTRAAAMDTRRADLFGTEAS